MDEIHTPGMTGGNEHSMGPRFRSSLGDMRFMGWIGMIYGILTCMTLVGIPLGIPLIIAAHRFIEGVNRFDVFRTEANGAELREGFNHLGSSFRILKILTIIYLVLTIGYLFFLFFLGGIGLLSGLADT